MADSTSWRDSTGQASVELVALLPLVLVCALAGWQLIVGGHAAWAAGSAARAAARAHAVGADPRASAQRVLPGRLERGLSVRAGRDGAVEVRVPVPAVLGGGTLTTITTRARFAPQA